MKDILLSKESEEIIREAFSQYQLRELEQLSIELKGVTIFHVYPVEDTIQEGKPLLGFRPYLLFDVHIYNNDTRSKYVISKRDGIDFTNLAMKVRVFKDSSVMFYTEKQIKVVNFQCIEVSAM